MYKFIRSIMASSYEGGGNATIFETGIPEYCRSIVASLCCKECSMWSTLVESPHNDIAAPTALGSSVSFRIFYDKKINKYNNQIWTPFKLHLPVLSKHHYSATSCVFDCGSISLEVSSNLQLFLICVRSKQSAMNAKLIKSIITRTTNTTTC